MTVKHLQCAVTVTIDTLSATDGQQTYSLTQWSLGGGSNLFKQDCSCSFQMVDCAVDILWH